MKLKIAIDAGHGKNTPGKRCLKSIDPGETREWVLNARIASAVADYLEGCGAEVLRLDDQTGQVDVALATRVSKANSAGAHFCVSIHHNAGINGGSGGGAVVYVYNGSHSAKSDRLQKAVYDGLIAQTGQFGNRSAPLASANFYMVRETNMPAILVEVGYMDSTVDTSKILSADFAAKAALGIAKGICSAAGLAWTEASAAPAQQDSFVVRVTADELNVRAAASASSAVQTTVKAGEAFTIVEEVRNGTTRWGRLKSGAGWIALAYTQRV